MADITEQDVNFVVPAGTLDGHLALPPGSGPAPAVIVVQEWWGVNEHIKSITRRLASLGFVALAPDLYHGKTTRDPGEAGQLAQALDTHQAVAEIGGAADFLRKHERSNGKVGVIGFCLGGALTLAAGCHLEGLGALVPFYGIPPADKVDYARLTAPVLGHYARRDTYVSPDKVSALVAELGRQGKSARIETYDADHAFVNDTRSDVYSAEAASVAWARTVEFLRAHLG